ncbi:MAG: hypothetical protein IJU84_09410 [Clostridia bacterium]|nr:hypothetical protein [Clostridia bacterium]
MKKIFSIIITAIMAISLSACGTKPDSSAGVSAGKDIISISDSAIAAGYARYDVTSALKRKTEGFGAQFDTCVLDRNNKHLTDWEVYKKAVKTSNLQAVRIRFYPEMYERMNDNSDPDTFDFESPNVDFNSIEMGYLYKLLDLFEENGVRVDLSWYGCRSTFASEDGKITGSWLGGKYGENGVNNWMVQPSLTEKPAEEFAESVAACLYYLIEVKKYTCLYEYSLFPEPEGVIKDMDLYGKIAALTKEKLAGYGIADKILFSGPADYGNNAENLKNKYLSGKYPYDKVDSSVYCFHGTTSVSGVERAPSPNAAMYEFAKNHVDVCEEFGASWGVAECGTSNFITAVTNADTELYDRAITMARFLINLCNAGCTNIKYFVFGDCSYDGILNEEGLFRFARSAYSDSAIDYQAKPVWYAWSLLMRYTDIGSEVYPITVNYDDGDDEVCITAFRLPDGSWTYAAANIGGGQKKIALVNGRADRPSSMKIFRLTAASTPSGADAELKIIDKYGDADASGGVAYFTIPANGIAVLSDKE